MRILVINGPNLNMLGKRNTTHYGELTLSDINKLLKKTFPTIKFYFYQTNNEARIIWKLQTIKNIDALIINPAAFTHTSIAIRDTLEIIKIPKVEVHLSDINAREEFRKIDYIKDVVDKVIMGKKENSYIEAVKYLLENK